MRGRDHRPAHRLRLDDDAAEPSGSVEADTTTSASM